MTAGIVAEYNPFHAGHAYHIAQTRRQLGECAVVCVMSGHFVQRGDCAVLDKWSRARAALEGGADLVLELPTVFAVSSAEGFARSAVCLLGATGVVDVLSFGSECGHVDQLRRVADCLDSPLYPDQLRRFLDAGQPFAACRQAAAEALLGEELAGLLALPNNNLGIEYVRALEAMKSGIRPITIPRVGAGHNGGDHPTYPSASFLRERLRGEQAESAASLTRCERAILARLRTMTAADWEKLPDSGAAEGLPLRLERAGRACTSLDGFFGLAKTKRYTHARLRRLVLWAFLGLTAAEIPNAPPYLRVLGLNGRGRQVLRAMKSRAALPVLTKPAHVAHLAPAARTLFALEARCTDLYGLCLSTPAPCGMEWRTPVVMA